MGMLKDIGIKTFYGKMDKTLPSVGELNPDIVAAALSKIMKVKAKSLPASYLREIQKVAPKIPPREQTFCPGCPHRASFWNINTALKLDGREGIVCGDIGCYAMASLWPAIGFHTVRTLHSMGSGTGIGQRFCQTGGFRSG
ncbi:MAG: hypothetical protein MZV70_07085 [Desulfobacterales bacterium]|nr:hypothetical protein [Desulfobacterales bacterium]